MKVERDLQWCEYIMDPEGEWEISTSSVVNGTARGMDHPGSSYLWMDGDHMSIADVKVILSLGDHYLGDFLRIATDQVPPIRAHIEAWVETGSLELK